jgi:histone deacetylase 1/2
VIKCKWVFRVKRTAQGAPFFKARLVAKGYSQKEGVDFFETWAPTAKQTTARCILHLAASRDLEVHAMDVDQAFLQGDLDETIYMEPAPGFSGSVKAGNVWLLKKPLYGLKQAPRQWHAKLKGVLTGMGLKCSSHDPSLFIGLSSSNTWILVYVDDLLLMAEDTATLQSLKEQLKQKFPLKDLGPISNYLGMEISRDRDKRELYMQQATYIENLQKRFADFPLSFYSTPLETNHGLTIASADEEAVTGQERYPELVGCLMYLMVCTRPDLAHSLSVLGRFVGQGRHGSKHWKAALRVLGYVVRTKDLKLTLGGISEILEGFTDASWADHQDDRKSSQGYCFTLGSGMISWKATRSPAVALSSCEAELYGGTSAAQELLWIKRLLHELNCSTKKPVLWCDNKSTVAQTKDPVFSARSKHIEARYFFIRELTQGGEMRTEHIAGEENPADIFTKALPRERHYKLLQMLGLQSNIGQKETEVPPSRGCVESRSSNSVICNSIIYN